MEPTQLPLLLAADLIAPEAELEPLDRLRMQKGVFLLEMAGPPEWKNFFAFEPWDWGPYSRDLTSSLNHLVGQGLMEVEYVQGRRWPRYRTSPAGFSHAENAWQQLTDSEREFVKQVRRFVTTRGFNQLLREVYKAYPDYATRSRFAF